MENGEKNLADEQEVEDGITGPRKRITVGLSIA